VSPLYFQYSRLRLSADKDCVLKSGVGTSMSKEAHIASKGRVTIPRGIFAACLVSKRVIAFCLRQTLEE